MSLWFFLKNHKFKRSPQQRTYKIIPVFSQRTSFYISHKASYSLEAAVVIPLIAGFLVTILFFFRILQVQCCIEEALLYAGQKTAVESSIVDSEALLFLSTEAFLIEALQEEPLIEQYIENGIWGIQLWKTRFDHQMIYLNASYVIKIPVLFWNIDKFEFTTQNCVRRWNLSHPHKEDKDYVYITPTGEVYHTSVTCRVLDLTIHCTSLEQISELRGESGQKYYACTRCEWKEDKKGKVYYTDYGTKFHKSLECAALKRTVDRVLLEDVGSRRPCSYCY